MSSTNVGGEPLITRLINGQAVTCLAIDERGHGESTMGGKLDYKQFNNAQQQAKILDAQVAFDYLKTFGAREENTVIVGGSIGANIAIQFLSEHSLIKRAVVLSPGLDYCGLTTADKVKKLVEGQKILIVTSDDDRHGSFEGSRTLKQTNPTHVDLIELSGAGHAETMLTKQADLTERIIDWLSK